MAIEYSNAQTGRFSLGIKRWWSGLLLLLLVVSASLSHGCRSARIKQAETANQALHYAEAASLYQNLYRSTSRKEPERKAYYAYQAAENYYALRQYARAIGLYTAALNYGLPDSLVLLRLASSHQASDNRHEATRYYQRYLAVDSLSYVARLGLSSLEKYEQLSDNRFEFKLQKASAISSFASDFAGAFSPDGQIFYFTSARSRSADQPYSPVTGEKNNMLYYIRKDAEGKWSRPDSVPGGINDGGDVGTPAISPDGMTLYYSYVDNSDLYPRTAKIYRATKSGDGGWTKGTPLEIWSDSLRMEAHPSVSADGKTLYFVSEGGYGGKDIYSIAIDRIGSAVPPTNVGPAINTPGDEMFPTVVGDSTLYFSSTGREGLGGLDLFVSQKDEKGVWRKAKHLATPFNSSSDDYAVAFTPTPDKGLSHQGYISSSRGDRRGYPHLFSFSKEAIITLLEGFVLDREENPIEGAVIRVVSDRDPTAERLVTSRVDGFFSVELEGDTHYLLHASHPEFLNQFASFETTTATESAIYAVDFYLASRVKPEVFQDIFYDFDRATLRDESKRDLDAMVKILEENPEIVVEISSHADRKGPDAYNITLSEARAAAVISYLTEKGIDPLRLKSQGYGKRQPRVVSEALKSKYPFLQQATVLDEAFLEQLSEEEVAFCDQLNRRTEFRVVE